jgi:hypothetical protein
MKTLENETKKQVLRSHFRDDPNPNFRVRGSGFGVQGSEFDVGTPDRAEARRYRRTRRCSREGT